MTGGFRVIRYIDIDVYIDIDIDKDLEPLSDPPTKTAHTSSRHETINQHVDSKG
jgi:hypothetical protein